MMTLRVAVAGGGLCLAQGLLWAGADVTIYERDASLASRRQGYRLHVDARAGLALQACLPPDSLALFQATCGQASRRLTVTTERLRVCTNRSPATAAPTRTRPPPCPRRSTARRSGRCWPRAWTAGSRSVTSWTGSRPAPAACGCTSPTAVRPRRTCWSARTRQLRGARPVPARRLTG